MKNPSVFTKIINKELPADVFYEDDEFVVISSIKPVAPVHLLVIPKTPIEKLQDIDINDHQFHARLFELGRRMADKAGVGENFQLHLNCGPQVQQVHHLHMHVIGGWNTSLSTHEIDRLTAEKMATND